MNNRSMTILTTLAFLGFSVSVLAAPPGKCSPWPECNGDDPDPPSGTEYTAALTDGGFTFNAVDVSPRRKGSIFHGEATLTMERPEVLDSDDQDTWDDLFDACLPVTVLPNPVNGVFVGRDDWSITNAGGKSTNTAGSRVTIMFNNITEGAADIDFSLIGELDFDGQFHPSPGVTNTITLNRAKIWGADNDNNVGCQSGEIYLLNSISLKICHKKEDGTGCSISKY